MSAEKPRNTGYISRLLNKFKRLTSSPQALLPDEAFATAHIVIVGIDSYGTITHFNPTAEHIFGLHPNETIGRPATEIFIAPQAAEHIRLMQNCLQGKGEIPHTTEYPVINKVSLSRIISWHNSVVQQPLTGFLIGTDITALRQREAELVIARQQIEQDRLTRLKLISAANHDLRQPLHATGLFISMLEQNNPTQHQSDILSNIKAALKSHAAMMQAIVDFSRLDSGDLTPKFQSFRLQHLFNKLEREFICQANAKDLAYHSRETPLAVYSDPVLLESILHKLIANAIQYTQKGGLLVSARPQEGRVAIEVWDTGIGIETARHHTLFEEFRLGKKTRSASPHGLGLSLSIADGLAQKLEHTLSFSSVPQKGSVFRITLPLSTAKSSIQEPTLAQVSKLIFQMRVLLIEDDISVRKYMQELFLNLGCECDAASSVAHAHLLAEAHKPDFVISDYRLNEPLNGVQAITSLRKLLGSQLPAMLITGHVSLEVIQETHEHHIHLLHKPVTHTELNIGIMQMLNLIR
jgi:two-component system, sensor histidine kinase